MRNGDDLFEPIRERLRQEADRLRDAHGGESPTAAVIAELGRRRRRRIATWAACSALAVLTALGTAGVVRGLRPARPMAGHAGPIHAPGRAVEGAVARNAPDSQETPPGSPRHASSKTMTPDPKPAAQSNALVTIENGQLALRVLFTVQVGDKQKVIGAGFYVPPRTEQVNLVDLSPAEQHAVRQVLGIPEDTILQGPI